MKTEINITMSVKEYSLLRDFIKNSIPLYKEFSLKENTKIQNDSSVDGENSNYLIKKNNENTDRILNSVKSILTSMEEN